MPYINQDRLHKIFKISGIVGVIMSITLFQKLELHLNFLISFNIVEDSVEVINSDLEISLYISIII